MRPGKACGHFYKLVYPEKNVYLNCFQDTFYIRRDPRIMQCILYSSDNFEDWTVTTKKVLSSLSLKWDTNSLSKLPRIRQRINGKVTIQFWSVKFTFYYTIIMYLGTRKPRERWK